MLPMYLNNFDSPYTRLPLIVSFVMLVLDRYVVTDPAPRL
jgi:hypothetical protein